MKRTNLSGDQNPSIFRAVRWPLVVGLMLLGHASLMMIAVVCSRTIPAATETVEDAAPAAPTPTLEETDRP